MVVPERGVERLHIPVRAAIVARAQRVSFRDPSLANIHSTVEKDVDDYKTGLGTCEIAVWGVVRSIYMFSLSDNLVLLACVLQVLRSYLRLAHRLVRPLGCRR